MNPDESPSASPQTPPAVDPKNASSPSASRSHKRKHTDTIGDALRSGNITTGNLRLQYATPGVSRKRIKSNEQSSTQGPRETGQPLLLSRLVEEMNTPNPSFTDNHQQTSNPHQHLLHTPQNIENDNLDAGYDDRRRNIHQPHTPHVPAQITDSTLTGFNCPTNDHEDADDELQLPLDDDEYNANTNDENYNDEDELNGNEGRNRSHVDIDGEDDAVGDNGGASYSWSSQRHSEGSLFDIFITAESTADGDGVGSLRSLQSHRTQEVELLNPQDPHLLSPENATQAYEVSNTTELVKGLLPESPSSSEVTIREWNVPSNMEKISVQSEESDEFSMDFLKEYSPSEVNSRQLSPLINREKNPGQSKELENSPTIEVGDLQPDLSSLSPQSAGSIPLWNSHLDNSPEPPSPGPPRSKVDAAAEEKRTLPIIMYYPGHKQCEKMLPAIVSLDTLSDVDVITSEWVSEMGYKRLPMEKPIKVWTLKGKVELTEYINFPWSATTTSAENKGYWTKCCIFDKKFEGRMILFGMKSIEKLQERKLLQRILGGVFVTKKTKESKIPKAQQQLNQQLREANAQRAKALAPSRQSENERLGIGPQSAPPNGSLQGHAGTSSSGNSGKTG